MKQVQSGQGVITQYTYDGAGNRLQVQVSDTTPPTTTASPPGGTYSTVQSVTLTCNDGTGSGCDKIYYATDGTTPTTSSPVYSSPVSITATTTLVFFATDLAGNSESVKTETYTISSGSPVVTIQFKDSNGNPLSDGVVQYYAGAWRAFAQDMELIPGSYTFRFNDGTSDRSCTVTGGSVNHVHRYSLLREASSRGCNESPRTRFGKVAA